MGRSISEVAYRALSGRKQDTEDTEAPPRPRGEVVWAHATDKTRLSALGDLARRLRMMRPGLHVLLTHESTLTPGDVTLAPDGANWVCALQADTPSNARRFFGHWQPDLCLWSGGAFLHNHISVAAERRMPMLLVDVGGGDFKPGRRRWFRDANRTSLGAFDRIMTNTESASRAIRQQGIAPSRVETTSRLRASAMPPPCADSDLTSITQDLAGRPVWLAACVAPGEYDSVLTAHRAALRLSHRLLLILSLTTPDHVDLLKSKLAALRLRHADWGQGDAVEDSVQVLISTDPEDLGLWYRVAPLTFMASSLATNCAGVDPLDAAALGSAILYGPNVGQYIETYSRLAAAGAARTVGDGESLGAAVVQLVAPDHAAAMALAGWEVATEGANLTDTLIDLIQDHLDLAGAQDERS